MSVAPVVQVEQAWGHLVVLDKWVPGCLGKNLYGWTLSHLEGTQGLGRMETY